jgi:hypothetical protein
VAKARISLPPRPGVSVIAGQRLWQAFAGALTVLLITARLDPTEQGWYYTFVSVAALYSVFEMGLSTAVLQMTAHNFLRLRWSPTGVEGEGVEEFGSFVAKSIKVYLIAALLFFVAVYPIGLYLFSDREATLFQPLAWVGSWTVLVFLTSLSLLTLPFLAVAEGSGAIAEVYAVRLVQGVVGSLACWLLLWNGAALWATAMMGMAAVCIVIVWLRTIRPSLWHLVREYWSSNRFDWAKELWPLQWRVGLGWVSVFAWSQLATPIVFFYQGPVAAGQIGLSLTIAHMVGIFAQSWIARGVPLMSQAVARQDWDQMRNIFAYDLKKALMVYFGGSMVVLTLWFTLANTIYSERVLSGEAFLALFLFVLLYLVNGALATQLRSFKKEPLLWLFFVGGVLSLSASWWAAHYSVNAVVYVMLLVQLVVVFPLAYRTWKVKNRAWQSGALIC